MPEVLTRLRKEHSDIAKLLAALEYQLAFFDAGRRPDYDVLAAIADYFVSLPDRSHHAKEDLVYRRLCERDPDAARTVGGLEAEHDRISALAHQFRDAVQSVLQEAEIARSAFDEVASHFVQEQRRHMQMEEDKLFPLALRTLTPEDWTEIDAQIARKDDPVLGHEATKEVAALRDRILRWEAEDEALEK